MKHVICLLFLASATFAQTEVERLRTQLDSVNVELQKALSIEAHASVKLFVDEALPEHTRPLTDFGFTVKADTIDGDYVCLVLPDTTDAAVTIMRLEMKEAGHETIKTSDPRCLRIHKNRLKGAATFLRGRYPQ